MVDVCDVHCLHRSCLHIHYDKGSFTPGVGYTSYNKNPPLVCNTRHLYGCPVPAPAPMCCEKPEYHKIKFGEFYKTCKNCRKRVRTLTVQLMYETHKNDQGV